MINSNRKKINTSRMRIYRCAFRRTERTRKYRRLAAELAVVFDKIGAGKEKSLVTTALNTALIYSFCRELDVFRYTIARNRSAISL